MSGRETGQVGIRLSNEIYGFPWALLAGGVDAAVVSRWQVQGASNEAWMRLFYGAMMSGQSPAQAGATAMRGLRAAGQTHPFYWAACRSPAADGRAHIGRIKDLSGIFAGASAAHALGFLVVRARSRALVGTHPEFSLIDQAYVFAGIQFAVEAVGQNVVCAGGFSHA